MKMEMRRRLEMLTEYDAQSMAGDALLGEDDDKEMRKTGRPMKRDEEDRAC